MNQHYYRIVTFDEYRDTVNRWRTERISRATAQQQIASIVKAHGSPKLKEHVPQDHDWLLRNLPEIPSAPDLSEISKWSRVEVLMPTIDKHIDEGFDSGWIVVVDFNGDQIDGFLYSAFGRSCGRLTISTAQIVKCLPPLGANELEDDADLVPSYSSSDDIPF